MLILNKRKSHRIRNDGEKVDVVIGLNKIDEFIKSSDFEVSVDQKLALNEQQASSKETLELVEDDIEQLHFYTPDIVKPRTTKSNSQVIIETSAEDAKKWHVFTIENESEKGVCLSSSGLENAVLFIGEFMFIRGYNADSWTLGVIRWMTVENTQLFLGLYLLSSNVEQVAVTKQGTGNLNSADVLWLAAGPHGDTLLLNNAEFKVGDLLDVDRRGDELEIELIDVAWSSDGFSQFRFNVKNSSNVASQDDIENQGFLIPE